MKLDTIIPVTDFYTDKGASQVATNLNAAKAEADPCATLTKKLNYIFGRDKAGNLLETAEVTDDFIALGFFKKGADIMWHNVEILVNTAAVSFTCEIGVIDSAGAFTKKATIGTPSNFVGTATIPEPDEPLLAEPTWIVAKITNATVPVADAKASFYVPYIALA